MSEEVRTERIPKLWPGEPQGRVNPSRKRRSIGFGDNGAGKSTLLKILTGFHRPSSGKIYFQGERSSSNLSAMRGRWNRTCLPGSRADQRAERTVTCSAAGNHGQPLLGILDDRGHARARDRAAQ